MEGSWRSLRQKSLENRANSRPQTIRDNQGKVSLQNIKRTLDANTGLERLRNYSCVLYHTDNNDHHVDYGVTKHPAQPVRAPISEVSTQPGCATLSALGDISALQFR